MADSSSSHLRTATDAAVLEGLSGRQPLALAEAYHRTVPAAHAVARRLLTGPEDVEGLLLDVYTAMWATPPETEPLEGWVRRATWDRGAALLRERGQSPASPSAAGLLPDLPAPQVRFLDAAERALADLADDERHALLLAHDKGVPTNGQEPGASAALTRALLALAGTDTSSADAEAMAEDSCDDGTVMGDWALGITTPAQRGEVDAKISDRPGCAARSRAVRRGRRRIEGLPATPDMGQRILVTVLTTGGAVAVAPAPAPAPAAAPQDDAPAAEAPQDDAPMDIGLTAMPAPDAADAVSAADAPPAEPDASEGSDDDWGSDMDLMPSVVATGELDQSDPDTGADAGLGAVAASAGGAPANPTTDPLADTGALFDDPTADPDDPFGLDDGDDADDDPFAPPAEGSVDPTAVMSTGGDDEDWRPDPTSTAELKLSDILAEGDDDDPFADLDDSGPSPVVQGGPVRGRDPYAGLSDLDGDPGAASPAPAPLLGDDTDVVGGYVEGQEDGYDAMPQRPSRMAAILSWLLPILGGTAIGIIVALQVFGPP